MFKSFWVPISSPLFAAYEYCAHKVFVKSLHCKQIGNFSDIGEVFGQAPSSFVEVFSGSFNWKLL
jgi:hypothetical protein